MQKLKPRAIIFDLGSTLIEYEQVPWDELGAISVENGRQFLISRGVKVTEADAFLARFDRIKSGYRKRANESLKEWTVPELVGDLFEKIGLNGDEKLIDGFFDAYYEKVAEQLFAYDDTVETLTRLKSRYEVLGLISNTIFPERVHHLELDRFGIAPHLNFTLFSSTLGLRKPHPDIFYNAANLAGSAPSDCLYVGDRYVEDVEGPASVGMAAILKIKEGREYPSEMPAANRRINNLSDLFEHIEMQDVIA